MANPSPFNLSQAHHYLSVKLTSKNFLHWKTQLEPFLQAQNLMRYLDGSYPRPSVSTSPSESTSPPPTSGLSTDPASWDQTDALLRSLLISSLSEEVFPIVVGKQTSQAIWEALHSSYASSSTSRILSLHLALQDLSHKPDEAVSSFLHRAKSLSDELAIAGQPLSVADFNLHVFRSLRQDFRDIIHVLMGSTVPLSFDELHSRLVSHEFLLGSHLKKLSVAEASPSPAVHAATNSSFRPPSRGRGRFPPSRGRGGPPPANRPWCSICNRTNHTASTCYFRPGAPPPMFPPAPRPPLPPLLPTPPTWPQPPHAPTWPQPPQAHLTQAAPLLSPTSSAWYPDTGPPTTQHRIFSNSPPTSLIMVLMF